MIREAGFRLILQMMTGLPGSSPNSDLDTARSLAALRPDGVRIYPTVIVSGTELERMWRRGEYHEHTVEDAVELCAGIVEDFDTLPLDETRKKPRVGIVGEILVKYMPLANNHLVELLE